MMSDIRSRKIILLMAAAAFTLSPAMATAQAPWVDPDAVQMLERMTEQMESMNQFSLHTQVTYEDLLDSGQRVDYDVSASVTISRPDKLHSSRTGELLSQTFYYDGKSLTLYNGTAGVYATQAAPASLEQMLDYARDELNLFVPASDLVYQNAFSLLMEGVNSAIVVGQTEINGAVCTHLAFSRPDVDFQVWVMDGEQSLPCKYVVTDTQTPARLSVSTVMSDWNAAPDVQPGSFNYIAPDTVQQIEFLPLDSASGH